MTSDEAEAAAWLEKQFWDELQTGKTVFCWKPKRNALTGRLMWLCNAVEATSGHTVVVGGGQYNFYITRWYTPKDFVIERLSR